MKEPISSPFKSPLSTSKSAKPSPSDPDLPSMETPQKAAQTPPRALRNRRLVFSVAELKRVVMERGGGRMQGEDEVRRDIRAGTSAKTVSRKRKRRTAVLDEMLPEKFAILVSYFDALGSSLRLFQMRETRPTFTNICGSMKSLLDREFTYAHLAQLKYILRELIDIRKDVVYDKSTCCMKHELQVSLQVDGFGNESMGKEAKHMELRKEFRTRLFDFHKAHPEADQVPVGELPEPFNHSKSCKLTNPSEDSAAKPVWPEPSVVPSHIPQSFLRRFSQRATILSKITPEISPTAALNSSTPAVSPPCKDMLESPNKFSTSVLVDSASSFDEKTPTSNNGGYEKAELFGSPARVSSTPLRLMNDTPDLLSPKRCCLSPNESPAKTVRHLTRVRSLKFLSPVKTVKGMASRERTKISVTDEDILKFLPPTLVQTVKDKEEKALEERDLGLAEAKRRRKMIACLPKLFDMIYLQFQSAKKSIMTKQELLHKIISYHIDVVDSNAVEEQLKLLQEILPDWICEKTISSGDRVVCISKGYTQEAIHVRLAEAE